MRRDLANNTRQCGKMLHARGYSRIVNHIRDYCSARTSFIPQSKGIFVRLPTVGGTGMPFGKLTGCPFIDRA